MKYLSVKIPFSGFYESTHGNNLDETVNQGIEDGGISSSDDVDFDLLRQLYAQHYARAFCDIVGLPRPEHTYVHSPREYNFETDNIICGVEAVALRKLLDTHVNWPDFRILVREECTSRSGFASFTPADVDEWGDCETWKPAQWELALRVALDVVTDGQGAEWEHENAMESAMCNGMVQQWLYSSLRAAVKP